MDRNMINSLALEMNEKVKELRHQLHQRAELALQEENTSAFIRDVLSQYEIPYTSSATGTVAYLGDQTKGSVLALRADIDALPITEPETNEYCSLQKGIMHACGHDCHSAMLLASAIVAKKHEQKLEHPVRFIFQPAEESLGGALKMIDMGCLKDVREIYCLHMQTNRPIGHFATKKGCIHASSDGFVITVTGKTGHGAAPQEGVDAIIIASQIVLALQNLISRETSPFENAVITIGKFHGGKARNVICDEVVLDGTLRTTGKEIREKLLKRIEEVSTLIASSMRGSASFELVQSYTTCINDEIVTDKAISIVKDLYSEQSIQILEKPSMGGEDFGFYEEKVPGCKLYLGTGTNTHIHTPDFTVNEDTLVYGVGFFLGLMFN